MNAKINFLIFAVLLFIASMLHAKPVIIGDKYNTDNFPAVEFIVTIMDGNKKPINDISKQHIKIFEDSFENNDFSINAYNNSNQGLNILLLIDTSRSFAGEPFDNAKKAIKDYLDKLGANDKAALVTFDEKNEVISEFSNSIDRLKQKVDTINADGRTTELHYAIFKSLDLFAELADTKRKVMIVLSDGKDEGKTYTLDDCIKKAKDMGIPVFSIGYSKIDRQYLKTIERLSDLTNGVYIESPDDNQLANIFNKISELLKNQYAIKHNSKHINDGKPHDYTIELNYNNEKNSFIFKNIPTKKIENENTVSDTGATQDQEKSAIQKNKKYIIIGSIIIGFGIICIALYFLLTKKKKPEVAETPIQPEVKLPDDISECIVCGNKYSKKLSECPVCALRKKEAEPQKQPPKPAINEADNRKTQLFDAEPAGRKTMIAGSAPMQITLEGITDEFRGKVFTLQPQKYKIGALPSPQNDIQLNHVTVSREHCIIDYTDQGFVLKDLNSTNGIAINGRKVQSGIIKAGDRIRLGKIEFNIR